MGPPVRDSVIVTDFGAKEFGGRDAFRYAPFGFRIVTRWRSRAPNVSALLPQRCANLAAPTLACRGSFDASSRLEDPHSCRKVAGL
jgi:hypothetical protein